MVVLGSVVAIGLVFLAAAVYVLGGMSDQAIVFITLIHDLRGS